MHDDHAELVISIGSEAYDAGCEISRIRSYLHANVTNLTEILSMLESYTYGEVIIVCTYSQMTLQRLLPFQKEISLRFSSLSVGFFCDSDAESLKNRYWLNRASKEIPKLAERATQFAFEHPDFAGFISSADVPSGSAEIWSLDDLNGLVARAWDTLYLVGHSNGHDAGLGRLVLCHGQHHSLKAGSVAAFPCHFGAPCRFDGSQHVVVSASDIQARIVVALLCWGVCGNRSTFSRVFTIGHTILNSTFVRTLITFMRATALGRSDSLLAYYLLNSGYTSGQVVNRLNRARIDAGKQAEFFCFGDPSSQIADRARANRNVKNESGMPVDISTIPTLKEFDFVEIELDQSDLPETVVCTQGMRAIAGDHLALFGIPEVPSQISVSTKKRSSVGVSPQAIEDILKECLYLRRFIRGCHNAQLDGDLDVLRQTVEELIDVCEGNWFGTTPTAKIIMEEASSHALGVLQGAIVAAQYALSDLLCANAPQGGTHFMRIASRYYRTISETQLSSRCWYCDDCIEMEKRADALSWDERVSLLCNSCGPVFEGHPRSQMVLEGNSTLHLGERDTHRVFASNKYGFPTCAKLNVHLAGYNIEVLAGDSTKISLDQSEAEVRIESHLYIPESVTPGLYYLQASLVIGADVCFFRKPILVQ